jgi:hypothetical protein
MLPEEFKKYASVIVDTFGAVFPNDHTHKEIFHCPVLVRSKELLGDWYIDAVEGCWLQKIWSTSVNPRGAYFCEVAAALDLILNTGTAFDIHTRWWLKKPHEYLDQVEALCSMCGVCLRLTPRKDTDGIDDIDEWWLDRLKDSSPKIKAGKYKKYKGPIFDQRQYGIGSFRLDLGYLRKVGEKFGLDLVPEYKGYLLPNEFSLRPYMLKG